MFLVTVPPPLSSQCARCHLESNKKQVGVVSFSASRVGRAGGSNLLQVGRERWQSVASPPLGADGFSRGCQGTLQVSGVSYSTSVN